METFIQVGKILTGTGAVIDDGIIGVRGNRISNILTKADLRPPAPSTVIDARACVAIPGFVQTHVHLCQTLFRGLADDLPLLDWLQKKIFPFEAAHSERSMYVSALIGIAELIRSGTTTILDMGSIHHEEEVIRAVGESGFRAFVGKAMMDMNDPFPKLKEPTKDAVASTRALAERWHNSFDDRVKYAVAPRFVLSCTDSLMKEAYEIIESSDGMLFHTHASENKHEVDAVRQRCKMENIEFLHHLGILSDRSCLAHCIHINEQEVSILKNTNANVSHCPSSNLKLGSGIADIPLYQEQGINVSLGADGAPCNNTLDMFHEMRLASLLQKPHHGATAMPARRVFEMATIDGARALGLEHEIGSIEVGKKADIVLMNLERLWNPIATNHDVDENIYSTIVYSATPENVDSVMINGSWVYHKKEFVALDEEKMFFDAKKELDNLLNRIEPA